MIGKKHVQWYADGAHVDLDVAELEIVLTYVLCLLCQAKLLDRLAFKGGTAIRKLHLGRTGRFSLDLDFTSMAEGEPGDLVLDLVDLFDRRTYQGITFSVPQSGYWATDDSYGAEVTYQHEWVEAGRLAIQISCRALPLLPVRPTELLHEQYFDWMALKLPRVPALDLLEVIGEKIRAAAQRARVRDVYDLYQFALKPYDRPMVRLIAVIKCWEVGYALDPAAFLRGLGEGKYDWQDLKRLVRRDRWSTPEEIIKTVRDAYDFLEQLSDEETRLARDPYQREVELYQRMVRSLRSKGQ